MRIQLLQRCVSLKIEYFFNSINREVMASVAIDDLSAKLIKLHSAPSGNLIYEVLHEDILSMIVRKLPLPAIYNLRAVNKYFRGFVARESPRIINANWAPVHPSNISLLLGTILADFPNLIVDTFRSFELVTNVDLIANHPRNFAKVKLEINCQKHNIFTLMPGFRLVRHVCLTSSRYPMFRRCITDFSRFSHLLNLELINIDLNNLDLTPIRNISAISVVECIGILDLEILANIKKININSVAKNYNLLGRQDTLGIISSCITDISRFGNIRRLCLDGCVNIIDISPLANVPELCIRRCKNIKNFDILGRQQVLELSYMCINDISHLSAVKKIALINVAGISDLSPIASADTVKIKDNYGQYKNIYCLQRVPNLDIELMFYKKPEEQNLTMLPEMTVNENEHAKCFMIKRTAYYNSPEMAKLKLFANTLDIFNKVHP